VTDQERIRVGLQRELTKLKGNLKYEKTAREGSSKRSAGYELECVSLREERDTLKTEQKINRRRLEELSTTLNQERMKRLRDLHLNEVLRKQAAGLQEAMALLAGDSTAANEKLLGKVLIADSAVAKNEVQRKIIDSQALEILEVTREVTMTNEKYKQAQNKIGEMEIALAKRTKDVLDFETEIWRLRKECTTMAGSSHSQQHVAFGRSYESQAGFSLPSRRIRVEGELRSLNGDIMARAGNGYGVGTATSVSSSNGGGSLFGQENTSSRPGRHVPESQMSMLSASMADHLPSRSRARGRDNDSTLASSLGAQPFSPDNSSVFSATTPYSPSRHGGRRSDKGHINSSSSGAESNIFVSKGEFCLNDFHILFGELIFV
jgi:hypothetical protein